MSSKSTTFNFFATADDLSEVLRSVEATYPLQYVQCGLFDESDRTVFHGFYPFRTWDSLGLEIRIWNQLSWCSYKELSFK